MAPQWMPKNIQKRLLLYVLQQLSFFSEIDLTNLDVSLGSSSQVTLTDVEIDTDAFQIPGVYLRNGKVKNIKLQLNMSGGVSIEGDGLDITVALGSSTSGSHQNGTERSKFSLAQSTMDLANSIMVDGDIPESVIDLAQLHESIPKGQQDTQEPSALNSMMTKAVEAALARLQIDIQDVNVRVIMDHATLDLHVKRVDLSTSEGLRTIKITDIMLLGIHPDANPGDYPPESSKKKQDSEEHHDDEVSSSDSDDDDDGNEMMSSSVLAKPRDLNESLVYSKEEASSIYMSAASDVFESKRHELSKASPLAFITEALITFNGLSKIEDLSVAVDEIKISATPVPLTLLHIIESFVGFGAHDTFSRLSSLDQKLKSRPTVIDAQCRSPPFKSLVVRKALVNLASAFNSDGSFAKPHDSTISFEHIELKYVNPELCHGSINKMYIIENEKVTGEFAKDSDKNDIRFELRADDFTLLLSKTLELQLDHATIEALMRLTSLLPQFADSLTRLKAKQPIKRAAKTGATTIQTSTIKVIVNLSPESSFQAKISPISYTSSNGELLIQKIALYSASKDSIVQLLTATNIELKSHPTEQHFRSYDNNGRDMVLMTPATLLIKDVQADGSLDIFRKLGAELSGMLKLIDVEQPEMVFKSKKKVRKSNNVMFQSRQSVKLLVQLDKIEFKISNISTLFGDITGNLSEASILLPKDGFFQFHSHQVCIRRRLLDLREDLFAVINPDDKSGPIISMRTKNFKLLNILMRNAVLDYYTKWLTLFGPTPENPTRENGVALVSDSENYSAESTIEIKLNLVDSAIGISSGRLHAKANLVIPNGNLDIIIAPKIVIKCELRGATLVLIDDIENVVGHEEIKSGKIMRSSWSQVGYFNAKGFASVGRLKSLLLNILIRPPITSDPSSSVVVDINSEALDLDLCADSAQCLLQLLNDLKQPVIIKPEARYKVQVHGDVNVFDGIEENSFNADSLEEVLSSVGVLNKHEPLNIVESYYDDQDGEDSELLAKDLSELALQSDNLKKNPYFTDEVDQKSTKSDSRSETSDSVLMFNDAHFQESATGSVQVSHSPVIMVFMLCISKVTIKIYDGYDWKYTRKAISTAVKRLEKRATEQRELAKIQRQRPAGTLVPPSQISEQSVVGETLFDSIHVSLPIHAEPSMLTERINQDLQSKQEDDINGIDVGKKNNIKKLKLRRSKTHKVMIELKQVNCNFTVLNNKDPLSSSKSLGDGEFEVLNELDLDVADFEVTDNVHTSTWNKFVTLMKDAERESGSSMLKLNMKTVRPVVSLAATEFVMSVNVLPLRLHVDQDTLEVLTRFGEFKDARFALVDEYEDIAYIQRFDINAVRIKLDYKPKKVDYAGLKSGHTTEFMNFFILDEADMILKQVTLHGVSGFPKLGVLLNNLWMPDIKANQLSGVLTGLAPVRSIARIGLGFKDLIVVPVTEYRKDGRLYRSLSEGIQQFTKTTTNEMLKFGVKIAAGTQALLENTEEALGGTGSSARITTVRETIQEEDSEDMDDDQFYEGYGQQSQLIGRGSSAPLQRSVYQPTLESIVDINAATAQIHRSRNQGRRGSMMKVRGYDEDDVINVAELDEFDELSGPRTVSLYADQPTNLKEGFLLAYDSFGRNLVVARDAIVDAGTEIGESGSAHDTTMAVLRATPVVLLRPVIGATEAASRALLGINNQLDPSQRDYTEDKYKRAK